MLGEQTRGHLDDRSTYTMPLRASQTDTDRFGGFSRTKNRRARVARRVRTHRRIIYPQMCSKVYYGKHRITRGEASSRRARYQTAVISRARYPCRKNHLYGCVLHLPVTLLRS